MCFFSKTTHHSGGFIWEGQPSGRWGEPCLALPGERGDRKFRVLNNRKAARSDVGRTGSDREASYDRPRSLYFIL